MVHIVLTLEVAKYALYKEWFTIGSRPLTLGKRRLQGMQQ